VYWLAHASVDWTWTSPAAGLPFFALLGIGASAVSRDRTLRGGPSLALGGAAAVVALAGFAPPWLAARFDDRAYGARSASTALSDLRWARRLDPLSTEPLETQAAISRPPANLAPLERAVRKQPRRADLRFELAAAYREAGRVQAAARALADAQRLMGSFAARATRAGAAG
jgi:cytochrome c-type biogenesis protein CcmH/NrfG